MKAADFIKAVRDDTQELYNLHQLYLSSNGEHGFRCLNPESLERKMNRTDREILEKYLADGAVIEDAAEYLAALDRQSDTFQK